MLAFTALTVNVMYNVLFVQNLSSYLYNRTPIQFVHNQLTWSNTELVELMEDYICAVNQTLCTSLSGNIQPTTSTIIAENLHIIENTSTETSIDEL